MTRRRFACATAFLTLAAAMLTVLAAGFLLVLTAVAEIGGTP